MGTNRNLIYSQSTSPPSGKAEYEIIDDPEPYYAHVPGLQGVWATGKTFEECRKVSVDPLLVLDMNI
jgi:hypothetical protein